MQMNRNPAVNALDLKQHRLAVRLPAWLLAEIDQEVERLRSVRPGGSLNRSDVVREILAHVLGERQRSEAGEAVDLTSPERSEGVRPNVEKSAPA
jgi:Arc/MetJ-type ribon-helix-helix transcriptional regulator